MLCLLGSGNGRETVLHGRRGNWDSGLGNWTMGTRLPLAKALGVYYEQGSKRFQLQAGCDQAAIVEGHIIDIVILVFIWVIFEHQWELVSFCGSVTFERIREDWDIYRTEYWEKENERRAILQKKIRERERKIAKQEGGWLWWTGYRGWKRGKTPDVEKTHHTLHKHGSLRGDDQKRTRSGSVRSGSHSRNSSRSSTPTIELEDGQIGHVRRGSSASSARRKKTISGSRVQKLTPGGSRSATPDIPSPLVRENSFTSISSLDSERSPTPGAGEGESSAGTKNLRSSSKSDGSVRKKPSSGSVTKQL